VTPSTDDPDTSDGPSLSETRVHASTSPTSNEVADVIRKLDREEPERYLVEREAESMQYEAAYEVRKIGFGQGGRPMVEIEGPQGGSYEIDCELPRPTALGPTRPSLVEVGASCFGVGTCRNRSQSGSRLRRRLPFTGGSECPAPTDSTLGHNRWCALLVTLEHHRERAEHRTTLFDRLGSKPVGERARHSCGRCIPTLLRSLRSLRGGWGLSALTAKAKHRHRHRPHPKLYASHRTMRDIHRRSFLALSATFREAV